MSVCSKFSQLRFCQILFELVYSWESYHKNKKGELFIETQCSLINHWLTNQTPWARLYIKRL